MAKKNTVKAVEVQAVEVQADALAQAENAVLALAAAGLAHYVDAAIMASGLAITQAEHDEARPLSAIDKAKAALAAIGVDIMALEADKATAGNLAVNVANLAQAFGKYGKHVYAADKANGTSLVTHEVARQILESGKCLLPEVLKAVRQHLPNYSSTGHYNTLKRMLKAEGYKLNVWQAGFSITK